MRIQIFYTAILIAWGNLVSYLALIFLGWLADDISFILACLVGTAFLCVIPGLAAYSAHSVLGQSKTPKSSIPVVLILCILFMLSAPGTVPYLKWQTFCESTFESAIADQRSCDFMCFKKLEVNPSQAISYSYIQSHGGKKTTKKKYYVPVVDEQNKIQLWVEGKIRE